jgi:imidazolonepropionase-like amidohydrolase
MAFMKKLLFYTAFLFFQLSLLAQNIKPINGVQQSKPKYIAIKNAKIIASPTKNYDNGIILIQDDKIIKIGNNISIPNDALILDYSGKFIYPSFIECFSSFGIEKPASNYSFFPQIESNKNGAYYWNEAIHPENNANQLYKYDVKKEEELLKLGFGIISTHQDDGIIQGTSSVFKIGLDDYNSSLLKDFSNLHFSFKKGVSNQTYPSSQMGSIALLRQTIYDLKAYSASKNIQTNTSLDVLKNAIKTKLIFQAYDKYEILRAQKIANEFALNFNYFCSGNEYQIIDELKQLKTNFILPINFPNAYDLKDPYTYKNIPLADLKHWELAPYNPHFFSKNNIKFALSSFGTANTDFWKNIRKIIQTGLSEEQVLNALTIVPAEILSIENELGTLEEGKKASFMVYDKNPFKEEAVVLESWNFGEQKILQINTVIDIRGTYNMILNEEYLSLKIEGTKDKPKASLKKIQAIKNVEPKNKKIKDNSITPTNLKDSITITPSINISGNDVTIQFSSNEFKLKGTYSLHGKFNEKYSILEGDVILPDGNWGKWNAIRNTNFSEKNEVKKKDTISDTLKIWYPNMAFGFEEKPKQQVIVIENVTLWTNEKEGVIPAGNIILNNGKIAFVGKGNYVKPKNAIIINGEGKHVSPGIIDEHSHIAISKGVNEGGQAISAEVSIGDVVRADDIEIYRQLSGGVTASQLLHGSANPIGGQSALIKLKWGHTPQEMLIPNAPKFIKFALGENVKQANWGDFNTIRFPQTRMGVEQIMYDAFHRAKKYELEKLKKSPDFRVDLELEVLSEILRKERFITCHSYVQSEINMLMHVADSMKFVLNTFTHILEGYKVADKMKKHGSGASTFADWWAYKYEVNDATPYNASLLNEMGIVTAINSDDAEMGRRLNQEAAKSLKYGGCTEEEALKMVTLNPAKLLHLDDRMGSLKVGKDADIVLWSDHPLSLDAKVEMTIIDGEILYDAKRNKILEEKNKKEKARLVNKMLKYNENGEKVQPFIMKKSGHFHCDTFGEETSNEANHH